MLIALKGHRIVYRFPMYKFISARQFQFFSAFYVIVHRLTFGEIGLPVLHVGMAAATMVGGYMQRMRFGWNVGYAAGLAAGAAYAGSAVAVASGYRDQGYGTALGEYSYKSLFASGVP